MAEYYAVLSKAVAGLEANSADARRAVYDKARNALIGQLKAIDPPLPTAEISRQRLELEEAIRRVERETSSSSPAARSSATRSGEARCRTAPPRQIAAGCLPPRHPGGRAREPRAIAASERAPVAARVADDWSSERTRADTARASGAVSTCRRKDTSRKSRVATSRGLRPTTTTNGIRTRSRRRMSAQALRRR